MSNSVLLNEMVFYELHSEFKEKILSRLFKKNGDKIIVGTSVQRQYYENRNKKIICEKIIKNLNYNEGLKIISKFNFPENIWSDSRESKHSGYSLTFYNVSLSFLVKKISNSNKETYEIANKIFQIISSFKSNDPVAVSRSSNHKLMGYEFICKKFTELKLKKLAKKTLDLWIDEVPKKDSNVTYMKIWILSGVNIQMLKLAKEFLSKNEIMHLMDLSLKGMDDNTELLLYLSELFYELNEKEKSIELSKTINENFC